VAVKEALAKGFQLIGYLAGDDKDVKQPFSARAAQALFPEEEVSWSAFLLPEYVAASVGLDGAEPRRIRVGALHDCRGRRCFTQAKTFSLERTLLFPLPRPQEKPRLRWSQNHRGLQTQKKAPRAKEWLIHELG